MSYSITGVRRPPDMGFRSVSRQTAEGAWEVAATFVADGMQEVEVHDAFGNLRTLRDLEGAIHAHEIVDSGRTMRIARN